MNIGLVPAKPNWSRSRSVLALYPTTQLANRLRSCCYPFPTFWFICYWHVRWSQSIDRSSKFCRQGPSLFRNNLTGTDANDIKSVAPHVSVAAVPSSDIRSTSSRKRRKNGRWEKGFQLLMHPPVHQLQSDTPFNNLKIIFGLCLCLSNYKATRSVRRL